MRRDAAGRDASVRSSTATSRPVASRAAASRRARASSPASQRGSSNAAASSTTASAAPSASSARTPAQPRSLRVRISRTGFGSALPCVRFITWPIRKLSTFVLARAHLRDDVRVRGDHRVRGALEQARVGDRLEAALAHQRLGVAAALASARRRARRALAAVTRPRVDELDQLARAPPGVSAIASISRPRSFSCASTSRSIQFATAFGLPLARAPRPRRSPRARGSRSSRRAS